MRKQMTILAILTIACLSGIQCGRDLTTGWKPSAYEYRYNVEVTYTRPLGAELTPGGDDTVQLVLQLVDPAQPYGYQGGGIWMTKVGPNTYKCTIAKVYVQPSSGGSSHQLGVTDLLKKPMYCHAEDITVQGAYDLGVREMQYGTDLTFKMSKE
jgi:hypothetical protein